MIASFVIATLWGVGVLCLVYACVWALGAAASWAARMVPDKRIDEMIRPPRACSRGFDEASRAAVSRRRAVSDAIRRRASKIDSTPVRL